MVRKPSCGKRGIAEDLVHKIVSMKWGDETWLGEVKSMFRNETTGMTMLRVSHFSGEPWAFPVSAMAVDLILPDPNDFE